MAAAGSIVIDLLMRTGAFESSIRNAEQKIASIGSAAVKAATAAGTAWASMISFDAIIRETEKVERNLLRTQAIIEATGATAGFTAEQLHDQARMLAFATLQSTEGVQEAQQVMLTFKTIVGSTFESAIELAADMSTAFGQSLTGSVVQLSKALEDPIAGLSALRRVGVSFTNDQKDLIRSLVETNKLAEAQGVILDTLAGQVGGIAKREALGYAGAVDTLGQAFQELAIEIGKATNVLNLLAKANNNASSTIIATTNLIRGLGFNVFEDAHSEFQALFTRRLELIERYRKQQQELESAGPITMTLFSRGLESQLLKTAQDLGEVEQELRKRIEANIAASRADAANLGVSIVDLDKLSETVQGLADKYLTRERAARELAEAEKVLNEAVENGVITQDRATQILDVMRERMEQASGTADKLALSMAEYAERAGSVLGLNARQKATLLELLPAIDAAAQKYGVMREVIIALIKQESAFNQNAKSPAGAMGFMQIMPGTAKEIAREIGVSVDQIYSDINTHIEAGSYYLSKRINQLGGDLESGLRAYNAGLGRVEASKSFKETNEYVEKVTDSVKKLIPIAGTGGEKLRDFLDTGATRNKELNEYLDDLSITYDTLYGRMAKIGEVQKELNLLMDSGRITVEEYAKILNEYTSRLSEQDYWSTWLEDAEITFENFNKIASDAISSFSSEFSSAIEGLIFDSKSLEEALSGMAEGMLRSVVKALAEMAAQWVAYKAVALLVGQTTGTAAASAKIGEAITAQQMAALNAYSSTAAIPMVGPAAAPAAAATALAATSPFVSTIAASASSLIPREIGGPVHVGQRYLIGERGPEMFVPNTSGAIVPNSKIGGGSVNINLIENARRAGQSETRQTANGEQEIDVFVADIMGDGPRARALQRAFGVQRVGY